MLYQRVFSVVAVGQKCSNIHFLHFRPVLSVTVLRQTARSLLTCIRGNIQPNSAVKQNARFLSEVSYPITAQRISKHEMQIERNSLYSCRFSTCSKWLSDKTTDAAAKDSSSNDRGELVYVGTMARLVRFVKMFSLSTSAAGIAMQPMIYNQVADMHWAVALSLGSVASFFVFATPLLLHLVTKRYVTRMHWSNETGQFNAVTYSFLLQEIEHKFNAKQVTIPTTPHLFTTVLINDGKKPLFIDPNLFLDRKALINLLKYNEPLEWELPQEGPSAYWDDNEPQKSSTSGESDSNKDEVKSEKITSSQQK